VPAAAPPPATGELRPLAPYSGPTLGVSEKATVPDLRTFLRNVSFVLFGRVHARPDGGRVASLFLLPEALWSVLLLPLAIAGVLVALGRRNLAVLIPAAYVGAIIVVISWLHGDEWSTYRFRNLYWPVLLVLVSGGITWTYEWWGTRRRAPGSIPRAERAPGTPGEAHT
jgi:hypothetical protein